MLTKIAATLCVLCFPIMFIATSLTKRHKDIFDRVTDWTIVTFMVSFSAFLVSLVWGI
jgi:hypothetical protein